MCCYMMMPLSFPFSFPFSRGPASPGRDISFSCFPLDSMDGSRMDNVEAHTSSPYRVVFCFWEDWDRHVHLWFSLFKEDGVRELHQDPKYTSDQGA